MAQLGRFGWTISNGALSAISYKAISTTEFFQKPLNGLLIYTGFPNRQYVPFKPPILDGLLNKVGIGYFILCIQNTGCLLDARMRGRIHVADGKKMDIVLILNLAKVLNLFESVFVMYNNRVFAVSDVISTYIYRKTFMTAIPNYGYTTAVGLFKSLVGCALVLICNWASKKVRGRGII